MAEPAPDRRSPLITNVVLLACFLALVVVGVLTVLVPELEDDDDEEQATHQAADDEPAEEPPPDESESE